MELVQLVYVSSSKVDFPKESLVELLKTCRAHNAASGITGILLYKDGNILQVLEGDRTTVEPLFEKIHMDPRHTRVLLLLLQAVDARDFPDWTMAFHDLHDPAVHTLEGFSEFLNQSLTVGTFADDPSKAKRLIGIFRANIR